MANYDWPIKRVLVVDENDKPINIITDYAERHSQAGASAEYVGLARAGTSTADAGWQIRYDFFDASTGDEYTTFANGTADFVNVWNNRAGISYW